MCRIKLKENAVPPGSEEDALHIAIAAAQGADYLLTWNFKHINNAEMKLAISYVLHLMDLYAHNYVHQKNWEEL